MKTLPKTTKSLALFSLVLVFAACQKQPITGVVDPPQIDAVRD